jgi:hypothetical protein
VSSTPKQLAVFGLVLAVLFGVGMLAGGVAGLDARGDDRATHEPAAMEDHGAPGEGSHGTEHATDPSEVHGLAVADNGLRLGVVTPELRRGREQRVAFRVLGEDGAPVRDYDVRHEKRMHLIIARRDLTGFQHLHPRLDGDGSWTTPVTIDEPGSYRLFTDFKRNGTNETLATDLTVDGAAPRLTLPAPARTATTDGGYKVTSSGTRASAGKETKLSFSVTRAGEAVETERYLGAGGHLVALREGDLAFLHVHPSERRGGHGEGGHANTISFMTEFPSADAYRLFLQFKHNGRVQTAAFTQNVSG